MKDKSILMTGASGLIGEKLCRALISDGYKVTALTTRKNGTFAKGVKTVSWTPSTDPLSENEMERLRAEAGDPSVVVNLAGHAIDDGRFSKKHKGQILNSRVGVTRTIGRLLAGMPARERRLVQSSAVGYYGNTGEAEQHEGSPSGKLFLSEVCRQWEGEANNWARKVDGLSVSIIRLGVVLDPDAEAWKKMTLPIKLGAGGPLGSGTQWLSWVSGVDAVRMFLDVIKGTEDGVWIGTAPQPERQTDLVKKVAQHISRPAFIPTPAWALKLALGEMADELLLPSCRAIPRRFQDAGFQFKHESPDQALGYLMND